MKRSGAIERHTPLTSKSPLKRTTALNASPASRSAAHARQPRNQARRYTGPSKAVLRLLAVRSEGLCEFWQCLNDAVHTHHRRPRRMGGSSDPATNTAANLVRLCLEHHDWAESRRAEALGLGLLLHASASPSLTPVYLRHGLVLLNDAGGWAEAPINDDAEEA